MALTLNPYKTDLVYKDLNELKTIVQKSLPSDDKLKNPKICNSLLKLYDEGKKSCSMGEEEKAFILLMRFVDSAMKLKRLTKSLDKDFVESMINNQVLKSSIEMLEKLQTSLTERYNERSTTELKNVLSKVKIEDSSSADAAKIVLAPPSSKVTEESEKPKSNKSMNPVEFVMFVEGALTTPQTPKRFLIIDIRPQDEFDNSHIDLSLFLSKFKHSCELVCINVPPELVEPVSWKIENNLDGFCKSTGNASALDAFKTRTSFDQLILIDQNTSFNSLTNDSKMTIFKRALYEFESEKPLKNEPIILDGGWDQWVDFYPGCCKRSVNIRKSVQESSPKTEARKSENFYPNADLLSQRMDAIKPKPAEQKSNIPKPLGNQPTQNGDNSQMVNRASFEKPTVQNQIPRADPPPPKPNPIPTIDRSKKPDFSNKNTRNEEPNEAESKPVENKSDAININDKKSVANELPKDVADQSSLDKQESKQMPDKLEQQPEAADSKPQEPPAIPNDKKADQGQNSKNTDIPSNSSNVPRNPVSQNLNSTATPTANVPRSFRFDFNRINDNIVDSIYKPSGYLAFNNRDNSNLTKVLDSKTGLFTFVEQSGKGPQPPAAPASNQPKAIPVVSSSRAALDIESKGAENKPNYKTSLNDTSEKKLSSKFESSNLKRTISTPNIASLADEEESDPVKGPVPPTNDLSIVKNVNNLGRTPVNADTAKVPNVDRNRKPHANVPSSETNLSSLLSQVNSNKNTLSAMSVEELQPVYSKDVQPGLTGLRNLGNTCFMNSIIQCLSNTRPLLDYFLANAYAKDLNRTNKLGFNGQIADEFAVIIQSIWRGYFKVISPRRFKYLIGQFNEQFITNEQQDAQELLLFLLDGLHEDLNKASRRPLPIKQEELDNMADLDASVASWKIHLSMNNSVIVDLFQGQFKSTVSCLTCRKESVKFDAFMYLTLPIPTARCTIFDCVELFLQPEKMSGQSKWKCPRCNQLREAVKKIDIWKLPQILIVHLKRFKYHGVWRDKITTFVDYPLENLNMDKYLVKHSPYANVNNSRAANNYYLYGISNHSGTMDGGHYISMCRHPTFNSWFKYDDSDVSSVGDSSSLKSSTSYILFYSRY